MMKQTMNKFLKRFRGNEHGAVTVDWVVLTAGLVALGITAMLAIGSETTTVATATGTTISERAQ